MSTWEEMTEVNRGDVPKGYVVRYHEIRGYDSPDRWYSAVTKRGRKIGEFGSYNQAVEACKKDAK
jgi:hypothetical protein